MELHRNEEKLNDFFINLFGLSDELNSYYFLADITMLERLLELRSLHEGQLILIRKNVAMQQFISYTIGLLMVRYRLDKPDLNIAHQSQQAKKLASYHRYHFIIDVDAIIPLFGEDSPLQTMW